MTEQSLNGTAPVKIFAQVVVVSASDHHGVFICRTSTMTIAKEKTSEPLVNLIRFCRISGAVHRVTWSYTPEVLDAESGIPATVEWEKSVICAWP